MQDFFKALFITVAFFASFILGALLVVNSEVRIDNVYRHTDWAVRVCSDHKGVKLLTLYGYKAICNDETEIVTTQETKKD
jgi:hypothetical protein